MMPACRQPGFTLLELIAALALSTLLMLGLLTVITAISSPRSTTEAGDFSQDHTTQLLISLVRHDLMHAQDITVEANHIKIQGYGALDSQSLTPTHRRAEVEYLIEQHEELTILVRQQRDVDDLTATNTHRHLLATDVSQFMLTPMRPLPSATTAPSSPESTAYRLVVTCSDAKKPLIDDVIMRGGAS
ncbi:prepilin-type N-terminal cleavage/methylation domain-containing protein [Planctomycetales bacterium ZRK34]|nr:prepilin-type N-terminal cleavage/methylation domain-containing protein [Planctomycetales bacterium ZRK34]